MAPNSPSPNKQPQRFREHPELEAQPLPSAAARVIHSNSFSIIAPSIIGFGMACLCIKSFKTYCWGLFLGIPVLVSFLSGFCSAYHREATFKRAYGNSMFSIFLLGCSFVVFALDGILCLAMALPLAALLAIPGTSFGIALGSSCAGGASRYVPLIMVALFPALAAFENAVKPPEPIREVTTSVVVDAPIGKVWETVIAFPKINEPPTGILSCGIAYPIEARIDGKGVGAVRHCIFSTGSFVEPITRWDAPTWLAFDVKESPPPMRELSIYEHVDAPHLHGHMVSKRGQFRLLEKDGKVVLEGTTWYTHSLSPQWYWGPISDYIIHRIHERVLNHIKRVAEAK